MDAARARRSGGDPFGLVKDDAEVFEDSEMGTVSPLYVKVKGGRERRCQPNTTISVLATLTVRPFSRQNSKSELRRPCRPAAV